MGYQRPILCIKFEGPEVGDLDGLEVMCRRMSVGHIENLQALAQTTPDMEDPENFARFNRIIKILADHLVSWNLEDENGIPVPLVGFVEDEQGKKVLDKDGSPLRVAVQSLRRLDFPFIMGLAQGWMAQAIGVTPPLSTPSRDGEPFLEGSIPMTDLPLPSPTN